MDSNNLGITIAALSIMTGLMTWLLGVVRTMRKEERQMQGSFSLATPAILYCSAVLIGFVSLFLASYTVLPQWSKFSLAYLGIAFIVVEVVLILFAPFIAGGITGRQRKNSNRILFTWHGLVVALLLLITIVLQLFIDCLATWADFLGGLSIVVALLITAIIMVGAYLEFTRIINCNLKHRG